MGYTYTYDDSPITTKKNHLWWQSSITQAGLILDGAYAIAGKSFNKRDKKLLGNRFAQFAKLTSEIRYNYYLGKKQHLVGRLMAGVAYSYGNSITTPYSEQFYIGGANSIRAFTIRSIGPGSYRPTDSKYGYLDQTGDIKLKPIWNTVSRFWAICTERLSSMPATFGCYATTKAAPADS